MINYKELTEEQRLELIADYREEIEWLRDSFKEFMDDVTRVETNERISKIQEQLGHLYNRRYSKLKPI